MIHFMFFFFYIKYSILVTACAAKLIFTPFEIVNNISLKRTYYMIYYHVMYTYIIR